MVASSIGASTWRGAVESKIFETIAGWAQERGPDGQRCCGPGSMLNGPIRLLQFRSVSCCALPSLKWALVFGRQVPDKKRCPPKLATIIYLFSEAVQSILGRPMVLS